MLTLAVYGPDSDQSPDVEIKDRIRDAERDANLLKLELPLEEAIEILLRAREGLQWLAANGPAEQRAKIEAVLAEREKGMAELRERLERRNARIAKRRAANG
jgi:hypothetical protein